MLVAAFRRRQQAEVIKLKALITAIINPEKAHDIYMDYMQMVLPEYTQIRERMDVGLMKQFEPFRDKKIRFSFGAQGVSAVMEEDKDAEL